MADPRLPARRHLMLQVTVAVISLSERVAAGDEEAVARLGAVARLLEEREPVPA